MPTRLYPWDALSGSVRIQLARSRALAVRGRRRGGAGFPEGRDVAADSAVSALPDGAGGGAGRRGTPSFASRPRQPQGCLGGRGPAERAEGIGQMREGGTRQRGPQQAVELAVEDGGGDGQEFYALGGQLHDR